MPDAAPMEEPSLWYSRGYLPHCAQAGLVQSITFRLDDALPQSKIDEWECELRHLEDRQRDIVRQRRLAVWLDGGHCACWLRDPRISAVTEETLLKFDPERYRLVAWCVMPNHVHAMIETRDGWPLAGILHSWKSYTASMANRLLKRSGAFWQREFFDRFIRDEKHYADALLYIEGNPVKAGLVAEAGDWRWSSAWKGR